MFLRVLRDALFSGPGSADLLLPRVSLGELFPAPALARLRARRHAAAFDARCRRSGTPGRPARVDGDAFRWWCSPRRPARRPA